VQMIRSHKVGQVALAGGKTLVIAQDFAWTLDQPEPCVAELALEHVKRFGGVLADLSTGEKLLEQHGEDPSCAASIPQSSATIVSLDGRECAVSCAGAPPGTKLRNRRDGDLVGNKPLKRLLNESLVPWYLRDFVVLIVSPDDQILGLVSENPSLMKAAARKVRAEIKVTTRLSPQ
jgi:hypothetical protein